MKAVALFCFALFPALFVQAQLFKDGQAADSSYYFYVINNDTVIGLYSDNLITNGNFKQYRRQLYKLSTYRMVLINGAKRETFERSYHPHWRTDLLVEGSYRNRERTGEWNFWADPGTDYSTCIQRYIKNTLKYFSDTIEYSSSFAGKRFKYLKDSSWISGSVLSKKTFFEFECKNGVCSFWQGTRDNEITHCAKEHFQSTLWLIENNLFSEDKTRFKRR